MPTYRGEHEDVILPFVDLMRHKTATSKYRGQTKWLENTPEDNFNQLMEEIKELQEALESKKGIEIMMEAADVANWAMFIAHQALTTMANVGVLGKSVEAKAPHIFDGIQQRNGKRTVVVHQDDKGTKTYSYTGERGNPTGGTSPSWCDNITGAIILEENVPWRDIVERKVARYS
jgi:NTP pyrophosphatase (non-canonical NTP hydrolase)